MGPPFFSNGAPLRFGTVSFAVDERLGGQAMSKKKAGKKKAAKKKAAKKKATKKKASKKRVVKRTAAKRKTAKKATAKRAAKKTARKKPAPVATVAAVPAPALDQGGPGLGGNGGMDLDFSNEPHGPGQG